MLVLTLVLLPDLRSKCQSESNISALEGSRTPRLNVSSVQKALNQNVSNLLNLTKLTRPPLLPLAGPITVHLPAEPVCSWPGASKSGVEAGAPTGP